MSAASTTTMPVFLTYSEATTALRISADTLHRAVQRGEVTRYGTVGRALFSQDEVLAWFATPKVKKSKVARVYRDFRCEGSNQGW